MAFSLFLLMAAAVSLTVARRASADLGVAAAAAAGPPPSLILVCRGATEPADLEDILSIERKFRDAFPCYDTRLAFTSDDIRALWRGRAADTAFREARPGTDGRFYEVKNVISELAAVQETGPRLTLVQGLHLIDGPEYHDLKILVEALRQLNPFDRAMAPFPWIGLGHPALGLGDGQRECIGRVASALSPVFAECSERRAGVVLVSDPLGGINPVAYRNLSDSLRAVYGLPCGVALHEYRQSLLDTLDSFSMRCPPPGPILLAPLAVVMCDEVREDIVGDREDSWVSLCRARGYETVVRLEGLGSNGPFAKILVDNLKSEETALSRRYIG
ncbi:MAG: sirohydrochlorin cobaltochelatase [Deltaproteobacteria bacterium]|jgi:cobalamin biosynthesis Co2+ chelatase CbiK|nr:sirohydrochlorin cobaltochelatase [Deltaproteobacteria bacterium]